MMREYAVVVVATVIVVVVTLTPTDEALVLTRIARAVVRLGGKSSS